MAKPEVVNGKVSKCQKLQISDGMPGVSCLVGGKSVTIISAGVVAGIFDDDEVSVALVEIPRMGGKLGVAYHNKTRDQKYKLPTRGLKVMGWLFTVVGIFTIPVVVGIFFTFGGIKALKLSKAINVGAKAIG